MNKEMNLMKKGRGNTPFLFKALVLHLLIAIWFPGSFIVFSAEPPDGIKRPSLQPPHGIKPPSLEPPHGSTLPSNQMPTIHGGTPCCGIVANPALKGRLGRLVVAFPDGASPGSTKVEVMKAQDQKVLNSGFGSQIFDLLPGTYEVKISGKLISGVSVESGHDTNVKVGVLRVTAGGSTKVEVLEVNGQASLHGGFGNQLIGLPVGNYQIRVSGITEPLVIQDGQISDF